MAEQKKDPQVELSRRDEFAKAFGAAVIARQSGRTATALAREVVPLVDAFLAELDKSK